MSSTANCTHVSSACPVAATIYGYIPNLAGNVLFTVTFGILFAAQLTLGLWKKTYSFAAFFCIGTFLEFLGYIGRLLLRKNVWNQAALSLQLVCLILAPTFLAGGIYVTLKHIVVATGPQYSRLKPNEYPFIFLSCDGGSIVIQAIGGALAATASSGVSTAILAAGGDLIMAGIAFQIFTMAIFCFLAVEYWQRARRRTIARYHRSGSLEENGAGDTPGHDYWNPKSRRWFVMAVAGAYFFILIRCIYRIHEFSGGWGNPRMRDEATFLILDGAMVALACILLTISHPGICEIGPRRGQSTTAPQNVNRKSGGSNMLHTT